MIFKIIKSKGVKDPELLNHASCELCSLVPGLHWIWHRFSAVWWWGNYFKNLNCCGLPQQFTCNNYKCGGNGRVDLVWNLR